MLPYPSGFNSTVGYFKRSERDTMPQYHTSAYNLSFIPAKALT
jgi:aminopeptidase-like protein